MSSIKIEGNVYQNQPLKLHRFLKKNVFLFLFSFFNLTTSLWSNDNHHYHLSSIKSLHIVMLCNTHLELQQTSDSVLIIAHSTRPHIQVLVLDLPSAHHALSYWQLGLQQINSSMDSVHQQIYHSVMAVSPSAEDTFSYGILPFRKRHIQLFVRAEIGLFPAILCIG